MSISWSNRLEVLRLPRSASIGIARRQQQNPQFIKRGCAARRRLGQHHHVTRSAIEHPQRDFDGSRIEIRRQAAAKNGLGMPLALPRLMHPHLLAEPRMPSIPDDSRIGTMGVPLLACTTTDAPTRLSATGLPPQDSAGTTY